jgi:hypothetical protein
MLSAMTKPSKAGDTELPHPMSAAGKRPRFYYLLSTRAWLGATVGIATLATLVFLLEQAITKPLNYWPFLIALITLAVIIGLVVATSAARFGIRQRQRTADLIEALLADRAVTDEDRFVEEARKAFVGVLEHFARDAVDLSKVIARREATEVVTARQVRRAAEMLSVGSASRRGSLLGSLGGVLLGVGLGQLVVILTSAKYDAVGVGLAFGGSMIGLAFISYQWFSS